MLGTTKYAAALALILLALIAALVEPVAGAARAPAVSSDISHYPLNEYPLPTANSTPYAILLGTDKNLWFTERTGNNMGRITPVGDIMEFPLAVPNSQPAGMVLGQGNNIRFTEYGANSIGRLLYSGQVSGEYPVAGSGGGGPLEITRAQDGSLWFTQVLSDSIGRIDPGSTNPRVTEPISFTDDVDPYGITTGRDGKIWFTLRQGNRIVRTDPITQTTPLTQTSPLTQTTAISVEFTLPTANSEPYDITLGPDGNLWFTEYAGNKIGRITPAGKITEYPLPNPNSGPAHITTGPDGHLWFTESLGNRIGRIAVAGQPIEEFTLPSPGSAPEGITAGPADTIWFTEVGGNRIGRLNIKLRVYVPWVTR